MVRRVRSRIQTAILEPHVADSAAPGAHRREWDACLASRSLLCGHEVLRSSSQSAPTGLVLLAVTIERGLRQNAAGSEAGRHRQDVFRNRRGGRIWWACKNSADATRGDDMTTTLKPNLSP